MSQQRLVLKDEDDENSEFVIQVWFNGESWESVGEADLDVTSRSESDGVPIEDNPLIYGMC